MTEATCNARARDCGSGWNTAAPRTLASSTFEEKWYADDELHGVWRKWNSNGVLLKESHFAQGRQEGLQSWWDDDGNLVAQGTVTDGVEDGTFIADVLNAAETATKTMVIEYRKGKLITDLHWG